MRIAVISFATAFFVSIVFVFVLLRMWVKHVLEETRVPLLNPKSDSTTRFQKQEVLLLHSSNVVTSRITVV